MARTVAAPRLQVYRNVKRLAEQVGAMAISIEDTYSGAFATGYTYASGYGYMDAERWAANVQAAVEATKGTDCMIIARTDCKGGGAPQTGAIAKFWRYGPGRSHPPCRDGLPGRR